MPPLSSAKCLSGRVFSSIVLPPHSRAVLSIAGTAEKFDKHRRLRAINDDINSEIPHGSSEKRPSGKNLSGLPTPVPMAEKMGEGLG